MARKKVPGDTQTEVLTRSRRRCCFCYFVDGVEGEVEGQIAHLDQDRNNNDFDNLAYLCLKRHDRYDTRTSVSKGLTIGEVRHYRDRLYTQMETGGSVSASDETRPQPSLQPEPEYGTGEFLEYLDGLSGEELYLLARFVLIEQSQTINCGSNDPTAATLVSKKFLTRVSMRPRAGAMRDRPSVPHNMHNAVWRHLNDNKRWLLDRTKRRNQNRSERLSALEHINFNDSYV